MEKEFIFDFGYGICEIKIKDFVIIATELKENEAHIFFCPEIFAREFCNRYNYDINSILCILHLCEKSYTHESIFSHMEIYRLIEFEKADIFSKLKVRITKSNLDKKTVKDIFKLLEEPYMHKQKLLKILNFEFIPYNIIGIKKS